MVLNGGSYLAVWLTALHKLVRVWLSIRSVEEIYSGISSRSVSVDVPLVVPNSAFWCWRRESRRLSGIYHIPSINFHVPLSALRLLRSPLCNIY